MNTASKLNLTYFTLYWSITQVLLYIIIDKFQSISLFGGVYLGYTYIWCHMGKGKIRPTKKIQS